MTGTPIFFLHNPKAGGSSLRTALAEVAGEPAAPDFCFAPHNYRAFKDQIKTQAGHRFYVGHYGYDVFRELNKKHFLVTNFRDPVQRIRSLYQYWRYTVTVENLKSLLPGDSNLVMIAKNHSFSEFIRHQYSDLQLYIQNFHFRQLYHSSWSWKGNTWYARQVVKRRISNMRWFYVAETPEVSHVLLNFAFPNAPSIVLAQHNRSIGEQIPVSAEDAIHIASTNVLDYEIYAHAIRVQSDRLKSRTTGTTRHPYPPLKV